MLISSIGKSLLGDEKPRNQPADDYNFVQYIAEECGHCKAS